MAITTLKDVFQLDIFTSFSTLNNIENNAFLQSGVMQTNGVLQGLMGSGSPKITIPYFNDLGTEEPNYSNDNPNDRAEMLGIDMADQDARISYVNKAWGSADLITDITGLEPNRRIAERVNAYWDRQLSRRAICSAIGIYRDNIAAGDNQSDMTLDISGMSGEAATFSGPAVVDTAFTMGDRALEGISAIAMHSMKYAQLVKQQLIATVKDADNTMSYQTYLGKRVIVDDLMPIFGTGTDRTFLTVLFGPGALAFGNGTPKVPTAPIRDELGGNGGGIEGLISRREWLIHPFGYKFTGAKLSSLTTSDVTAGVQIKQATLADLQDATNWERVVDRKQVGMAFLVTK